MPLPLILGAAAAVAGTAGIGTAIHGGVKLKKANDTMKEAEELYKRKTERFEIRSKRTNGIMDELGTLELEILKSFDEFSDVFERIQNRPEFKEYHKDGVQIPEYNGEQLKKVSVGAGVLIGGLGGAATGTAGGFAAAGATTAAVMALGCASTGTPIAALSGAAVTNATLAALGGGALAAGGGGMALGTTILGATTLGVGLLVGGIIFNVTGMTLSKKADEAMTQADNAAREIDRICKYLDSLYAAASMYQKSLQKVNKPYRYHLNYLQGLVYAGGKTDWNDFTDKEKLAVENTVLLTGLLYKMCQVQLVLQSSSSRGMNRVNTAEIDRTIQNADAFLKERNLNAA